MNEQNKRNDGRHGLDEFEAFTEHTRSSEQVLDMGDASDGILI